MPKKKMPTIQEIYKSEIDEILTCAKNIERILKQELALSKNKLQCEREKLLFIQERWEKIRKFIDISNNLQFFMGMGTIWEQESNKLKDSLDSLLEIDNVNEFYQNISEKMIAFAKEINECYQKKVDDQSHLFKPKAVKLDVKKIFERFGVVHNLEQNKIKFVLDPQYTKQNIIDDLVNYLNKDLFNSIKKRLNGEKIRKKINSIQNQINSIQDQIDSIQDQIDSIQYFKKILQGPRGQKNFKDISSFRDNLSKVIKQLEIKLPKRKHKVILGNLLKKIERSFKSEICYHIKLVLYRKGIYQDNKDKFHQCAESVITCFKKNFSSLVLDNPGFYPYVESIVKNAIKEENKKITLTEMVQEEINKFKQNFYQLQYKYKQIMDFIVYYKKNKKSTHEDKQQHKYIFCKLMKDFHEKINNVIGSWLHGEGVSTDDALSFIDMVANSFFAKHKDCQPENLSKQIVEINKQFFPEDYSSKNVFLATQIEGSIKYVANILKTKNNKIIKEKSDKTSWEKFCSKQNVEIQKCTKYKKCVKESSSMSSKWIGLLKGIKNKSFIKQAGERYGKLNNRKKVVDRYESTSIKYHAYKHIISQFKMLQEECENYKRCYNNSYELNKKQHEDLLKNIDTMYKSKKIKLLGKICHFACWKIRKYNNVPFLISIFKKTKFRGKRAQKLIRDLRLLDLSSKDNFVKFLGIINDAIVDSVKTDGKRKNWKNKRSKYRDILNQTKELLFTYCPKEQLEQLARKEREYLREIVAYGLINFAKDKKNNQYNGQVYFLLKKLNEKLNKDAIAEKDLDAFCKMNIENCVSNYDNCQKDKTSCKVNFSFLENSIHGTNLVLKRYGSALQRSNKLSEQPGYFLYRSILGFLRGKIKQYRHIPFLAKIFTKKKFRRSEQSKNLLDDIDILEAFPAKNNCFVKFLEKINNAILDSIQKDNDKHKNWKNKRSKYRDILNQTKKLLFNFCPEEQLRDLMQQEMKYINKIVFESEEGTCTLNDRAIITLKTKNSSDYSVGYETFSSSLEDCEKAFALIKDLSANKKNQKERKIGFSYLFDGLFGYYNTVLANISSLQKPDEQKCDTAKIESSLVLEQDEDTKKDKNNKKKKVKQPEEGNRLREPDSDKKENDT
ncbi:MAG: hypothetical protein PVI75_05325, partial [Gammaproteobacteria bacterium]